MTWREMPTYYYLRQAGRCLLHCYTTIYTPSICYLIHASSQYDDFLPAAHTMEWEVAVGVGGVALGVCTCSGGVYSAATMPGEGVCLCGGTHPSTIQALWRRGEQVLPLSVGDVPTCLYAGSFSFFLHSPTEVEKEAYYAVECAWRQGYRQSVR